MKLHHVAFWTNNMKEMIGFYQRHFEGEVLSEHQDGDFRGAFLKICSESVLELMSKSNLDTGNERQGVGYSHLSFEVPSKEEVDRKTEYFERQSVRFEKKRVQYEDGFYESAIFDPDGNIIEIAYVDRSRNKLL